MASVLGLIALGVAGVGVTGLIRGRVAWARLHGRGVSGGVTAAAITVFLVVAVVSAPATRPKAVSANSAARSAAPPPVPSVDPSAPTSPAPPPAALSTAPSLAPPSAPAAPATLTPPPVAPLPPSLTPSSEVPAPLPAAEPERHCANGPLPGQDVIFWSVVPGTPPTAAVLGQYTGTNCQSTIDLIRATSPTADGDCTLLALQSDNPGYNVNAADPMPRPRQAFLSIGPGC